MSETTAQPNLSIEDYERLVDETWRQEESSEDWHTHYADLIKKEFMEMQFQHGPGIIFLSSLKHAAGQEARDVIIAEDKEAYDGLIEELGDLLWFSFRTAAEAKLDPKEASALALTTYTGERHPAFQSFAQIQEAVSKHATVIGVPSKHALRYGEPPLKANTIVLANIPDYVFMRMVFRLARSLEQGRKDVGPFTASMLEPVPELAQSIGDCINVASYLAHDVLGIDIEEVARRNIDKLQKRSLPS